MIQGMKVLVLSLVTNAEVNRPYRDVKAEVEAENNATAMDGRLPQEIEEEAALSHEEVLKVSMQAAKEMSALVAKIVELASAIL